MESLGRRVSGAIPRPSRAAHIPPRVLAVLEARSALTVLRGPRGYGKTTAIMQWLDSREDDVPTVYLALDAEARLAHGFWAAVRRALDDAGLTADDGMALPAATAEENGVQRAAALRMMLHHDAPLRLVIDNFHEAGHLDGHAVIDEDLLDAVRSNPALDLVVAARGLRTLETTGALSVDLAVVRPADLAMRPEDVMTLAQQQGVAMTQDHAAHLVHELGGWPAALRTCIAAAAVGGRAAKVSAETVDGYIDALLADLRSPALREFLMRTAVPDEFSASAANAILPDGAAIRELRNLRVAGLLQERDTVEGLRYSYPPAIRDALRRVTAELRPEIEREVHIALMSLAAREQGPVAVLGHAVRAQEWATALRIIEEEWSTLVTRHPRLLVAVADAFPHELGDGEPRLRVIRQHLRRMASPPGSGDVDWRPTGAHFVDAAITQRWRELRGTTDDVLVLVQSGVASIFAGENGAATYALERVRDHGITHDDRTARLLGIGGMLAAKAVAGEADLALGLLADPELADVMAGGDDDDVSVLVRVTGRIARAIAAVDALKPEAHEAVDAILEPARRDELWGLAVSTRGLYASVYGSFEDQARAVGQLRAGLRHMEPGGIAESTLATQLVELLVASGMTDLATQVLDRLAETFVSSATRSYLLHSQGREQEAIDVAERGLADPRMTARSRLLSELMIAAALHRLGQVTAAGRRFARGVRIAHETGQRRAFAMMTPELFAAFAGSDPDILALRPLPSTLSAGPPAVPPTTTAATAELSARELEVLIALQDNAGPAGVAAALGMSVNTAKTHLRHVYRKLGASSREEALVLSRDLAPVRR